MSLHHCHRCTHMTGRPYAVCSASTPPISIIVRAKAGDCPLGKFTQPLPKPKRPPIRGLGDVVERVASALGIKKCGECAKRQGTWNRAFPLKK